MLTGELRNKVDQVWNAFWSGGIATNEALKFTHRCVLGALDALLASLHQRAFIGAF